MSIEKNIEERLKQLIINKADFELQLDDIKSETDIIDDLGFDSIKVMRLIIEIENEFKMDFKESDLKFEIIAKYNRLLQYIEDSISLGGLEDAQ